MASSSSPCACSHGKQSCGSRAAAAIGTWHIAFVQDCNLRCRYCSTGFGRMGMSARVMKRPVWERLITFVLDTAPDDGGTYLEFGFGETFVAFDEFLTFVDEMRRAARARDVPVTIVVATNGTLLDGERLQACLDRRIGLHFSIDGDQSVHDRHRRDRGGIGTHARALDAWRRYRELVHQVPDPPSCSVQSVVAEGASLIELDAFWRAQGVPVFNAKLETRSHYLDNGDQDALDRRRRRYLSDFETLSVREAERLDVPGFLSGFQGPDYLLRFWTQILFEDFDRKGCAVGLSVAAVDCEGFLYPCEGFHGRLNWRVGDLFEGVAWERFFEVRREFEALKTPCLTCEAAGLCNRGCAAASPDEGVALNDPGGCDFFRSVARVAMSSYQLLSERASRSSTMEGAGR